MTAQVEKLVAVMDGVYVDVAEMISPPTGVSNYRKGKDLKNK